MLSPELELLLISVQRHLTPAQIEQAKTLLARNVQIDTLAKLAQTQGLSMLLYRGLLQLRDSAPASLMRQLEEAVTTNAVVYEWLYPQQVADVAAALGVESIVLKGPALGQETYRQPALRPYGDIDLLVHHADLDTAEQQLLALGYTPDESVYTREWYREQHHHLVPYTRPNALPIEIHQGLVETGGDVTSRIDLEMLWQHAQPLMIAGVTTHMLAPEHQLIHLCVHAVGVHLFEMGLLHLCDVYETLIEYGDRLDLDMVAQHSTTWGCSRQVQLMLGLVTTLFEVKLPAHTLYAEPLPEPFIAYSLANMLNTAIQGMPESSGLAQVWTQEKGWRKFNGLTRRLFPTSAEVANRYKLSANSPLRWVHYPRWQAEMVRRHFGTARQLMQGDTLEQAHYEAIRRELLKWLGDEH